MYKKIKVDINDEVSQLLIADRDGKLPKVYDVASLMSLFYAVGTQRLHVIDSIIGRKIIYNQSIKNLIIKKGSIVFIHGGFRTLKGRKLAKLLDELGLKEKPVTLDIVEFLEKLGYSIDYYSKNMAFIRRDILEPALKDMRNNGYNVTYSIKREGNERVITFTNAK